MSQPTVVFVPGLRDHVADHWQTLMQERMDKAVCVPRLGKTVLARAAWVAALQGTLTAIRGPVIVVAHSAGVMMLAHWAKWHRAPILGALLATPPDFQTPLPAGYPTLDQLADNGWMPVPRQPLPFPSVVAASRNDPIGRYERVALLAADWGSRLVDAGDVGHLNAASGFGEWAQGLALVEELGLHAPATAR